MKIWKNSVLFTLGGLGYCGLELIWRGRTHYSMFLAGGTCLLLLGKLNRVEPKLPLPLRAVAGSGIITMVELAAGLIFNRDHRVWDYRGHWGNWLGQICPLFSLIWITIALAVLLIYDPLEKRLFPVEESH